MKNIDENDFNELIKKNTLVLVEFGAEWCAPCKKMKPFLEELENEFKGEVEVYFLDISKSQAKAMEYEILSIPQILIFKDGVLVEKVLGEQKKENFKKIVEKYI